MLGMAKRFWMSVLRLHRTLSAIADRKHQVQPGNLEDAFHLWLHVAQYQIAAVFTLVLHRFDERGHA